MNSEFGNPTWAEPVPGPIPAPDEAIRLQTGSHADPHSLLGAHPDSRGVVVRAYHPDALDCTLVLGGTTRSMAALGDGLFALLLPDAILPVAYRLRFHFANGESWEREDPYRFAPTLGEMDLHLFGEGTHRRLWNVLGARVREMDGVKGTSFAVWAPNAKRVSVIGEFCGWDGRIYPMRSMGGGGVWEIFIPEVDAGEFYRFEIVAASGSLRVKTDPYARRLEVPPAHASIVTADSRYPWGDGEWMQARSRRNLQREPMSVYELHAGSWARVPEEGNRSLTYRELAPMLAAHVRSLGFTHVELMPIMEHPFGGSWGYQVSGYYAPSARYGLPDDFRFLVDTLHQAGLGVILDWVPAHFPKDDWALRRFDGSALYEHEDPRLGEHPDWGTLIFNFGRNEVRNFLIANALYWMNEFHVDGLRVDAVASMLYLDYSREPGEWLRNRYGGRENLEAIDFIRSLNEAVREDAPGCFMVAEESTAWPGVTTPVADGGLGFTFKWNMGWMHDTLKFFAQDPLWRGDHLDSLTFAMVYEYSERFTMPLSHDEVVHGKGSLLERMPGDDWQKFANLRLLLAYQFTRPGKKLLFMGSEVAQRREWDHDSSVDWHLRDTPMHGSFEHFVSALGQVYREHSSLWALDHEPEGFRWIDASDRANSVLAFVRQDGEQHVVVVLNFTPVPRADYRIGVPGRGKYRILLNSDNETFGGSGAPVRTSVAVENTPFHGFERSVALTLPPLGALLLMVDS
ncbi:MAG TPA: 1,4-alpha-glucan branching protein GlgB [Gemmatimonadales bacterium]|nr:1,4-alpha-glucan branching protein GlgB [Gemmatimonadales bacterium]